MYRIIVKSNGNEVYLCLFVKGEKKYQDFTFHNGVCLANETSYSSDLLHGLSFHIVV